MNNEYAEITTGSALTSFLVEVRDLYDLSIEEYSLLLDKIGESTIKTKDVITKLGSQFPTMKENKLVELALKIRMPEKLHDLIVKIKRTGKVPQINTQKLSLLYGKLENEVNGFKNIIIKQQVCILSKQTTSVKYINAFKKIEFIHVLAFDIDDEYEKCLLYLSNHSVECVLVEESFNKAELLEIDKLLRVIVITEKAHLFTTSTNRISITNTNTKNLLTCVGNTFITYYSDIDMDTTNIQERVKNTQDLMPSIFLNKKNEYERMASFHYKCLQD